jgi:hypothetical protein
MQLSARGLRPACAPCGARLTARAPAAPGAHWGRLGSSSLAQPALLPARRAGAVRPLGAAAGAASFGGEGGASARQPHATRARSIEAAAR